MHVTEFHQLKLGPLLRNPVIIQHFEPPPDLTIVPKVSSTPHVYGLTILADNDIRLWTYICACLGASCVQHDLLFMPVFIAGDLQRCGECCQASHQSKKPAGFTSSCAAIAHTEL